MTFKRFAQFGSLAIVMAAAFLLGYGTIAKAWPGVPDRGAWYGYFDNIRDTQGNSVIGGGYPDWVNSADTFISFVQDRLANGSPEDKTGAAFTIDTMLGEPYSRDRQPTADEMTIWRSQVRAASVNWFTNFTYTVNTYWQGDGGGGPEPNDDAFYYENGTRLSMVFTDPNTGRLLYVIKRDCGNPLTNGFEPGLVRDWNATGRATVSSPTAVPGQTVTFQYYVKNNGPTAAAQVWWGSFIDPAGQPFVTNGPDIYDVGQERNVNTENFTIPANAPAGVQYCRVTGWDPINSAGDRNGRSPPACVTVVIPAKLKAVMSVNPTSIIGGDTATFTPGISVQSAGSPVTVNCTITRTLTPPSGAPSDLGNQPCVDSSGNPNINVSGGGVTLRPNTYASSDTIAVGTKVCDTITITNPTLAAYFNSAADKTATTCVVVAKTPYVQFLGNDVFAGGDFASHSAACNIQANITTVGRTLSDGSTAGSVVEYSAYALGKITNFGSAGKVLVGSGALGDAARQLTFANSEPNATKLGYYGAAQHCINDYVSLYSSSPTLGSGSYNVSTRGSGAWHVPGALTLSGTMPAGGLQVYYADGDVTIGGNLQYPATYSGLSSIPSLVVITKGNIFVPAGVTQMDGVFIASGNGNSTGVFYTCYPKNEPASITNACNNSQLVVNGSVTAARIDLFRSFGATGSGSSRKDPAEVFNFNPELYLRNAIGNTTGLTVKTSTELDLPPRF